jgi:hypothetical protein
MIKVYLFPVGSEARKYASVKTGEPVGFFSVDKIEVSAPSLLEALKVKLLRLVCVKNEQQHRLGFYTDYNDKAAKTEAEVAPNKVC